MSVDTQRAQRLRQSSSRMRQQSPLQRIQHLLHSHPALSPLLVLVVACIVFTIINPRFAQPGTISIILQQTAVIAALAIGQTLIILTAGIDLVVGAISHPVDAGDGQPGRQQRRAGDPGAADRHRASVRLCGLLNGLLVTRLNLPPFIVTLGTLSIFTAIGLLYSGGASVGASEDARHPELDGHPILDRALPHHHRRARRGRCWPLVVAFVLSQTAWGRHVYAVGDDLEAARLVGIRVDRVLLSVYTVAGLIYGLTAWVLIGRAGTASPNAIVGANLETITAVVIGGTSLFGGRGGIIGTILGRVDRRSVPHRSEPGRRRRPVARAGHRRADHRRRLHRPVDPEGEGMSHTRRPASPTEEQSTVGLGAPPSWPTRRPRCCRPAGLIKTFGKVVGLDGVDVDLFPGEVLAVIGDNGAGKSTLIKALTGALIPDSGQVFLDGQRGELQDPAGRPRRRHRDGLPDARGRAGPGHLGQHVPRSRAPPARRRSARCSGCWTRRA